MDWSSRFNSGLDECIHLVLGLMLANALEEQYQDLIDSYGIDITNKAINTVKNDYSTLLARF